MTTTVRRAVCPGSFDPVTLGHLDIFERMSRLYDEVYVAVFANSSKQGFFDIDERLEMLEEVTADLPNVKVDSFQGLVVDYCKSRGIDVVIKGIRAVSDFDYELSMAQMNHGLSGVETFLIPTNRLYSFVSSSLVRDVAKWGGDVSGYVPETVARRLVARLREQ
ncbi:pantetheine-phosphate adenylyltransferase [Phytomonospora endophytica]|uniref:Phosphopantetheine adenylyltransferase n=1 Tax=Phytomonospora endophytica TaxID=714109 RepID=A0A841FIA9_9ACTN|nr:pantetheine-phosphate adenylyltransferase [Phytomonospora endophytica]GIG69106.1 phosphopantetheine adenylyltransferase [Phytomonospora endophytica]